MKVSVSSAGGKVVVDLHGRRRDLLLDPDAALRFAEALEAKAAEAELAPAELVRGEPWGVSVASFDGFVAFRFTPPFAGDPERVPLPPRAARAVADLARTNASVAREKLRIALRKA